MVLCGGPVGLSEFFGDQRMALPATAAGTAEFVYADAAQLGPQSEDAERVPLLGPRSQDLEAVARLVPRVLHARDVARLGPQSSDAGRVAQVGLRSQDLEPAAQLGPRVQQAGDDGTGAPSRRTALGAGAAASIALASPQLRAAHFCDYT